MSLTCSNVSIGYLGVIRGCVHLPVLKSLITLPCLFFGYSKTVYIIVSFSDLRDRSDWHLGGVAGLVALRLFKTLSVLKKAFLAFMTPNSIAGLTTSKVVILLLKSGIVRGDKIWEDLVSEALGECLDYF